MTTERSTQPVAQPQSTPLPVASVRSQGVPGRGCSGWRWPGPDGGGRHPRAVGDAGLSSILVILRSGQYPRRGHRERGSMGRSFPGLATAHPCGDPGRLLACRVGRCGARGVVAYQHRDGACDRSCGRSRDDAVLAGRTEDPRCNRGCKAPRSTESVRVWGQLAADDADSQLGVIALQLSHHAIRRVRPVQVRGTNMNPPVRRWPPCTRPRRRHTPGPRSSAARCAPATGRLRRAGRTPSARPAGRRPRRHRASGHRQEQRSAQATKIVLTRLK